MTTAARYDAPTAILSLHAHPDDECMLTGELLAKASAQGPAHGGGLRDPG